jgi:hypothetical protein
MYRAHGSSSEGLILFFDCHCTGEGGLYPTPRNLNSDEIDAVVAYLQAASWGVVGSPKLNAWSTTMVRKTGAANFSRRNLCGVGVSLA